MTQGKPSHEALSAEARALLDAARGASGPSADRLARVHHAVRSAAPAAPPVVGALGGLTASTKGIVAVAAVIAVAALAAELRPTQVGGAEETGDPAHEVEPEPPSIGPPALPSTSSQAMPECPVATVGAERVEPPASPSPRQVAAELPSPPRPTAATERSSTPGPSPSRPRPRPARSTEDADAEDRQVGPALGSLAAETALLRRAQQALRRGDPTGALEALAEHADRFPDGVLRSDREAARLISRCRLGPLSARLEVQARSALARSPRSPYAARIRTACLGGGAEGEPSDPVAE
jgi:hypothetical protein